jgi:hypothetical protein
MVTEARQVVGYSPTPGTVPVKLLAGPLSGVEVSVPASFPPLIAVHGERHGIHTVWITHTYRLTDQGYEYVRTEVDHIRAMADFHPFSSFLG